MKFNNLALAALGIAGTQAQSSCTFSLNLYEIDDVACEGDVDDTETISMDIGVCTHHPDWGDDVFVYVPYCSMTYGMSYFVYEDASCLIPYTGVSSQFGCPNRGCCHFTSADTLTDIDGDGSGDFAIAITFSVDVYAQVGSEFGLSFFECIGEAFKFG